MVGGLSISCVSRCIVKVSIVAVDVGHVVLNSSKTKDQLASLQRYSSQVKNYDSLVINIHVVTVTTSQGLNSEQVHSL